MGTNQGTARVAGLLYLVEVLTGMFNLLRLPSRYTVDGNVAATLDNIAVLIGAFDRRVAVAT